MAGKPCFACGAAMSSPDGKSGQCSNPACPGGRRFYYCGYCREISFSLLPDRMKCFNKACKTFDIPRAKCPTCDKISIIPYGSRTICVNRDCTDNASIVAMCFFCSNKAFLNAPDLMFCTKGSCEYLFKKVAACAVCKANSHIVDDKVCKNSSCEIAGMIVETCPNCNERTLAESANGSKRCLNKECKPAPPPPPPEPDFEGTLVMPGAGKKKLPPVEDPSGALAVPPEFKADPEPYGATMVSSPPPPPPPEPKKFQPQPPKPQPQPQIQVQVQPPPEPPKPQPPAPGPGNKPPIFGGGKPPPFGAPKPEPPAHTPPPPPVFGRQPDPGPRPTPGPAPAPGPRLGTSAIEETYQFLRSTFMEGEGGTTAPLYLIIGLAGSGKSTYLTFLGDILGARQQRYCFPYEGIDVKWIKIEDLLQRYRGATDPKKLQQMRARVKDLVYDFGQEMHERFNKKQVWAPATLRDEGDELNPATFFLVTEVTRHMKSLAKVVTLETSGEEYEEVLKNFKSYTQGIEPKNAIQKVLVELMDQAEGFIVLLDPDNIDADAIFKTFFMVLKEEIQPRALNSFYAELGQGVSGDPKNNVVKAGAGMMGLLDELRRQQSEAQKFEEQVRNATRMAQDRLIEIAKKLEAGRDDTLQGEDGKWLETLEKTCESIWPNVLKVAKEKALPTGAQMPGQELRERVLRYYKGFITSFLADKIGAIVQHQLERTRPPSTRSSILDIKKKYGLSDSFKIQIDQSSFTDRPVRRFRNLKYINLTITKSDKYPIIWPPEMYPRKKLAGSEIFLRDLQDYLKLCGGCVRYYNASATGYSLLAGGAHIPGPANTHTPINILEPLFDMLNIQPTTTG